MNNTNDKSELLREIAIFDYVAGNQSEQTRLRFEELMSHDASLSDAVKKERLLRESMSKVSTPEPVSMSNFDTLLTLIDKQENKEKSDDADNVINISATTQQTSARITKPFWMTKYAATAASVAVFAIVFSGVYFDSSRPKFETLSDQLASQEISFKQLVKESRLAKITLKNALSDAEIKSVLRDYNLMNFDAGAETGQRFVISESSISDEQLANWRGDERIVSVALFTSSNE